jgi:hypothetical protein
VDQELKLEFHGERCHPKSYRWTAGADPASLMTLDVASKRYSANPAIGVGTAGQSVTAMAMGRMGRFVDRNAGHGRH